MTKTQEAILSSVVNLIIATSVGYIYKHYSPAFAIGYAVFIIMNNIDICKRMRAK